MSGSNASSSSVTTDMNATDYYNFSHDVVVVTVWFVTVIYGLITNFLIFVGICRSATMRNSTSYWLILILSFCDVMMLLITLFHLLPSTLWHDAYLIVEEPRNYVTIFIYDTFWYTGVFGLGMMSINRFASIMYPTQYSRMFSPSNTVVIGVLLFLVGTAVSIPALFECCITLWDHHNYVTRFKYPDTGYAYVDLAVNSLCTIVMVISYAFIVLRVRQSRLNLTARYTSSRETRRIRGVEHNTVSSREFRLVVQFFVVSIVFLSTFVTWQILPRVSASKWIYAFMTELFFINNGVNPTVYLIFNSGLRKELQTLCGPTGKSASSDQLSRNNNITKVGAGRRRASCIPMQISSNSDQPELDGVQV